MSILDSVSNYLREVKLKRQFSHLFPGCENAYNPDFFHEVNEIGEQYILSSLIYRIYSEAQSGFVARTNLSNRSIPVIQRLLQNPPVQFHINTGLIDQNEQIGGFGCTRFLFTNGENQVLATPNILIGGIIDQNQNPAGILLIWPLPGTNRFVQILNANQYQITHFANLNGSNIQTFRRNLKI